MLDGKWSFAQLFDKLRSLTPDFEAKIIPIIGDITNPNFGLNKKDEQLLTDNCDIIINAGASVRFFDPLKYIFPNRGMINMMHLWHLENPSNPISYQYTMLSLCAGRWNIYRYNNDRLIILHLTDKVQPVKERVPQVWSSSLSSHSRHVSTYLPLMFIAIVWISTRSFTQQTKTRIYYFDRSTFWTMNISIICPKRCSNYIQTPIPTRNHWPNISYCKRLVICLSVDKTKRCCCSDRSILFHSDHSTLNHRSDLARTNTGNFLFDSCNFISMDE